LCAGLKFSREAVRVNTNPSGQGRVSWRFAWLPCVRLRRVSRGYGLRALL